MLFKSFFLLLCTAAMCQIQPMLKPKINLETLTRNPTCDLSYFSFGSLNIVDQAQSGTVFLRQDIPANGDFKLYSELFKVLPHRDLGIVWQQVKICQILAEGSAVGRITVRPTRQQQQKCPVRAGAYFVSNFTVRNSLLRDMPAGRYYLSTVYRNDVPICGAKVTFAVVN